MRRSVALGGALMIAALTACGCTAPNLPDLAFPSPGSTTVLHVPWAGGGCPAGYLDDVRRVGVFGGGSTYDEVTADAAGYPAAEGDPRGCFVSVLGSQDHSVHAYIGVLPARPGLVKQFAQAMADRGFIPESINPNTVFIKGSDYWTITTVPSDVLPSPDNPFTAFFDGETALVIHSRYQ